MSEVIGAYCSSITKHGVCHDSSGEIRIANRHHQIFASRTREKNVTYQEDPWQGSHRFLPYQAHSPLPTHQEQVPEPCKWAEVGGLHHSLSGSQVDQQEGSASNCHPS